MQKIVLFSLVLAIIISLTACHKIQTNIQEQSASESKVFEQEATGVKPNTYDLLIESDTKHPIVDTTKPTTTTEKAEEFNQYIENMDTQDIENTLNEKPTDTQKDAFDHAIGEIALPEINSEITLDEDGTAHYIDTEGNEVEVGLDETVINKTEEELEDDYERMLAELKGYQAGSTSNTQGTQGNQGTTGNQATPGTNGGLAGNNIDASDDISPEEYAEVQRKLYEQILEDGGTLIGSEGGGQISQSEEEYIRNKLNGVGVQSINTVEKSEQNIDYGDDLTPEQAAEARRKAEEAFLNGRGTIITDQREGTISDSEREYIRNKLNGASYNP